MIRILYEDPELGFLKFLDSIINLCTFDRIDLDILDSFFVESFFITYCETETNSMLNFENYESFYFTKYHL